MLASQKRRVWEQERGIVNFMTRLSAPLTFIVEPWQL
jgi:hypothetical protein